MSRKFQRKNTFFRLNCFESFFVSFRFFDEHPSSREKSANSDIVADHRAHWSESVSNNRARHSRYILHFLIHFRDKRYTHDNLISVSLSATLTPFQLSKSVLLTKRAHVDRLKCACKPTPILMCRTLNEINSYSAVWTQTHKSGDLIFCFVSF